MKDALSLGPVAKKGTLEPQTMISQSFNHDLKKELANRCKALENEKQVKIIELIRERIEGETQKKKQ